MNDKFMNIVRVAATFIFGTASALAMAQASQTTTHVQGNTEINVQSNNVTAIATGENNVARNRIGVIKGDKKGEQRQLDDVQPGSQHRVDRHVNTLRGGTDPGAEPGQQGGANDRQQDQHDSPPQPVQALDRRGHPVGFAAELYSELILLRGDEGARRIVARYPAQGVELDDPGVLLDVDTEADLEALRRAVAPAAAAAPVRP